MVNLAEYFVGAVGAEGMFQKIMDPSVIIFETVMVFLTTSIYILLNWLIDKKFFILYHATQNF